MDFLRQVALITSARAVFKPEAQNFGLTLVGCSIACLQIQRRCVVGSVPSESYTAWTKQLQEAAPNLLRQLQMHVPLFPSLDFTPLARAGATDAKSLSIHKERTFTPPPAKHAELYLKVLRLLHEAESSGQWPKVTPGRNRVLQQTTASGRGGRTSARKRSGKARRQATKRSKKTKVPESGDKELLAPDSTCNDANGGSTDADALPEEEKRTAGTFSIGAMPPPHLQPANRFPELLKAAFELERAVAPPGRKVPSTTIAVNKHALFVPHRDSGAGAGQSQSMIVGLGDYSGGELMVEGRRHDIRYQPIEFNGWKERHYTLPFQGERYSLVYFTPHGF